MVSGSYTIRRATLDDAQGIAEVIASVEPELVVSEVDADERRDRIRWLIETEQNVWFVAEADGRIVGELALALGDPAPASLGLSVSPSWRKRGIGASLLRHALEWASAHAVHKIAADVFPENVTALSLLEKHGFEEEGRLRSHYRREKGEARDAVLLGLVVS